MATAWGQNGASRQDKSSMTSQFSKQTFSHLHLDVGLSIAAASLVVVPRVRVAALALQAALRRGSVEKTVVKVSSELDSLIW